MSLRVLMLTTAALIILRVRGSSDAQKNWCERVCPITRLECPTPCPDIPTCPTLPLIPACPIPHCPPPVVNLTCPEPRCPPPPPTSPPPSCPSCPVCHAPTSQVRPPGYQTFPGIGHYKFYSDKKTWLEANATCSKDGGYLAIPNNKMELFVIVGILKKYNDDAFVGFNDLVSQGDYVTSIGQPMDNFQRTLWAPGEPDELPDRDAIYMNINGGISDIGTYTVDDYLCEIPLD